MLKRLYFAQNLPMNVRFQDKKNVCKSLTWLLSYQVLLSVVFFGTPCIMMCPVLPSLNTKLNHPNLPPGYNHWTAGSTSTTAPLLL